MIEMLGVLAIIGVLSVGGIAGYSKAMTKYRINKTIEQITLVSQNVRSFFASQGNYAGLDFATDTGSAIIKKAKLVPDEMWGKENGADVIYSLYDGYFQLSAWGTDSYKDKIFYINFDNISSVDVCIDLVTQDWESSASGAFAVAIGSGTTPIEDITTDKCDGIKNDNKVIACKNGTTLDLPMSLDVAAEICGKCESNSCDLGIMFK